MQELTNTYTASLYIPTLTSIYLTIIKSIVAHKPNLESRSYAAEHIFNQALINLNYIRMKLSLPENALAGDFKIDVEGDTTKVDIRNKSFLFPLTIPRYNGSSTILYSPMVPLLNTEDEHGVGEHQEEIYFVGHNSLNVNKGNSIAVVSRRFLPNQINYSMRTL